MIDEGRVAYGALVEAYFHDGVEPVAATQHFFDGAADLLETTGFADACPIATIAGEIADTHEPLRIAAAEAFDAWISLLAAHLVEHGADRDRADAAAIELFCLLEGAFLLGRTTRSAEPVRTAGRRAVTIVSRGNDTSPDPNPALTRRAHRATMPRPNTRCETRPAVE